MDQYYGFFYKTVKQIDPNHLYFGFWFSLNEAGSEEWPLTTGHCDVYGYDYYSRRFAPEAVDKFLKATDKPVFCGEFGFPIWHEGARGYGQWMPSASNEAKAGRLYAQWIDDAASNPFCIGVHWFQYRDQPVTGRGPGLGDQLVIGEHFAFGLVDVTDQPKTDLVTAVAAANAQAARRRVRAMGGKPLQHSNPSILGEPLESRQ